MPSGMLLVTGIIRLESPDATFLLRYGVLYCLQKLCCKSPCSSISSRIGLSSPQVQVRTSSIICSGAILWTPVVWRTCARRRQHRDTRERTRKGPSSIEFLPLGRAVEDSRQFHAWTHTSHDCRDTRAERSKLEFVLMAQNKVIHMPAPIPFLLNGLRSAPGLNIPLKWP